MLLKIVQLNWNLFEVFWFSGGFWERDTIRVFNFPPTLFMCRVYACMTTAGSRLFLPAMYFLGIWVVSLGSMCLFPLSHFASPTYFCLRSALYLNS